MKKLLAIIMALILALSLMSVATFTASADAKKGDANGDGGVDMKDVLVIRKFIAGLVGSIDETAADMNDDNSVDMKDVLQLRLWIAESDTLRVDKIKEKMLNASPAVITQYFGTFTATGSKHTYSYTPTVSERFSLYLSDMPEGMNQWIEIYNPSGECIAGATHTYYYNGERVIDDIELKENGETVSADLIGGEEYRFVVTSHYACSYTLNVAYKKTVDVSDYTAIVDKMEYANQKNTFTYTPKETGYVCLTMSGMPEGMKQWIQIYNPAGDLIAGATHEYYYNDELFISEIDLKSNGETVSAILTAGQTYTIIVTQHDICPYRLHVVHKNKVDVSGYKKVKDSMEHSGQHNTYIYTPSTTTRVNFYLDDMPGKYSQWIQIYNPAGDLIAGATHEYYYNDELFISETDLKLNGETVSADLTAGQTYTIVVSAHDLCDYTLFIG